jgi:hypothetical protein
MKADRIVLGNIKVEGLETSLGKCHPSDVIGLLVLGKKSSLIWLAQKTYSLNSFKTYVKNRRLLFL